jgi:hypothetical protein
MVRRAAHPPAENRHPVEHSPAEYGLLQRARPPLWSERIGRNRSLTCRPRNGDLTSTRNAAIGSGFCEQRIEAMIDRAIGMQIEDPAAASALWAEIDREIVDQAPYVWLVNPPGFEFVPERVSNYQESLSGVCC